MKISPACQAAHSLSGKNMNETRYNLSQSALVDWLDSTLHRLLPPVDLDAVFARIARDAAG